MSPQKLAFFGDAVFELMMRKRIIFEKTGHIGELNILKNKNVCCKAQSDFFDDIKDILTNEEINIYKRGRNAHVNNTPKKASRVEYHRATGIEALFGYLYLTGDKERLAELIQKVKI
ncbi:MAG: ribonuclease III [Clostridia bacterium]|nr:ribonuclease III [Clostridia bacterium]